MDDAVGGVVAKLRQLHLEENTLILFAGDNGAPGRFDTPLIGSWNGSNNIPMRGPKGTLHEGESVSPCLPIGKVAFRLARSLKKW